MLQGWKNMHPEQHYIKEHGDLYEDIDDPVYIEKEETFKSWDENPIDLPGRWYLQVITQLFKENRLAKETSWGWGDCRHWRICIAVGRPLAGLAGSHFHQDVDLLVLELMSGGGSQLGL
jgi:hypothetical protein